MEEENVTAIAAEREGAAPLDLGKFKSVDALMKAYEELEAEFTRRSQRLKALEKSKAEEQNGQPAENIAKPAENAAKPAEEVPAPSAEGNTESGSEALYRAVMESGEVRERVLADYLRSLRGVPLMTKGTGVTAPPQKPKTFAEAGSLALGYLKNKK